MKQQVVRALCHNIRSLQHLIYSLDIYFNFCSTIKLYLPISWAIQFLKYNYEK